MVKKVIKFDHTEIGKYKSHQNRSPSSINDIDINEIVVSSKLPFGKQDFTYFIDYKGNTKLDLYAYSFQK